MQYSARARRAIGRLYRQYNDIDVYVEDKTYVGVYERIINSSLKGRGKVTKVIPLGPKAEVVRQAAQDTDPSGRPRLYIVDGDLDLVAYKRQAKTSNLYRLNVYSVENLLLSEEAIEEYCQFASPSLASGVCSRKVKPGDLLSEVRKLVPYIVVLAVAKRLNFHHPCLAFNPPSVTLTVQGKHIGPDGDKVAQRVNEVRSALIERFGIDRYEVAEAAVKENISARGIDDHRIVPGKIFGMMYLNERVAAAGGLGLPHKAVVSYLAEKCDLRLDKQLQAKLRKLAKAADAAND